jgi:endonuclease-8
MPEGDTIHRAAARLRAALEGQALRRLELVRGVGVVNVPPPGTTIDAVEAVGKHLLIRFAGGTSLRTHLRMTGSWHLYRSGERWRRPSHLARAVVEVDGWVAVCFAAPVVELAHDAGAHPPALAHLGPDLTRADTDHAAIDAAVSRMERFAAPADEIGTVLLDQRVACGVGNVYKSEVLFACRVNPFTRIGDLDPATRRRLLATASKLLRADSRPGAVYRRAGRPCRRCGTPIRSLRQGAPGRTSYWCPTCQPATSGG